MTLAIEYSSDGDTAYTLVSHKGIDYWSLITPGEVNAKRDGDSIEVVAQRKNERAMRVIDAHVDMCKFFGYVPYQGEYREANKWHPSDKSFFYLWINKWRIS